MSEIHEICFYAGFFAFFCYFLVVCGYCFYQVFCVENLEGNRDGQLDRLTPRLAASFRMARDTIFDTAIDISDLGRPLNNV